MLSRTINTLLRSRNEAMLLISLLLSCLRHYCSSHFSSRCCDHVNSSTRSMISPNTKGQTSSSKSFNAKAVLQTPPRESGTSPRPSSAQNVSKPARRVQTPQSPCSILTTSPGSSRWLSKPNDAKSPMVCCVKTGHIS